MTKARKADGRMVTAHLKHVQEPTSGISAEPLRMASPAGSIASRWPRSLACANTRSSLQTTFTAAFSRETARSLAGGFAFRGAPPLHVLAASVLAVTMLAGCVGGESSSGGAEGSIFAAAKPDWAIDASTKDTSNNNGGNGPGSNSGGGNKKTTDSVEPDSGSDSSTDTSTDTSTNTSTDTSTDTSADSDTVTAAPEPVVETKTWYVALQAIDDKGQYSPDSNEAQGDLASGEHVTLIWEAPNMTLDGACTTVDGYMVKLGTGSGDYSHSVSVSTHDRNLSCKATSTNQCGSIYTCETGEIPVEIPAGWVKRSGPMLNGGDSGWVKRSGPMLKTMTRNK
jgi:hypothetical protein